MWFKIFKYGLFAAAATGVVFIGSVKFQCLKNLPKDIMKSLEDRAKAKIQPEKINFC